MCIPLGDWMVSSTRPTLSYPDLCGVGWETRSCSLHHREAPAWFGSSLQLHTP